MPTLNKYKNNNGYYILSAVPGVSPFTLQVTQEGVRYLHQHMQGQTGAFDGELLEYLRDQGLVYTKGLYPLRHIPALSVNAAYQRVMPAAGQLFFVEGDVSWIVEVRINEIPKEWVRQVENLTAALTTWKIRLDKTTIPATRLWPGRGGVNIAVHPQRGSYKLIAGGQRPQAWNIETWLQDIAGLGIEPITFRAESGERIPHGSVLTVGESYYVVAHESSLHTLPNLIEAEDLGRSGTWRAWRIRLPATFSAELEDWCRSIRYYLTNPRCKLTLTTPPVCYTRGLPCVVAGDEIVLALQLLQADASSAPVAFYKLKCSEPGTLRVAAEEASAGALFLEVVQRQKQEALTYPPALSLKLVWGEQTWELQAYRDETISQRLQPPRTSLGTALAVDISCAVPLNLQWRSEAAFQRREQIAAAEAQELILQVLRTASQSAKPIEVIIDGRTYGRLCLEFSVPAKAPSATPSLSPIVERRARWLAAVLGRPRSHTTMQPASPQMRELLMHLAQLPGCAALSHVQAVPSDIIPHLYALRKYVHDINHR